MSYVTVIPRQQAPSLFARLGRSLRSYMISGLSLKDPALKNYFMDGPPSYAGIPVNEKNAFTYSAVFDAVNQISSDVAKLPLNVLKRLKDGGSEPFTNSKLYNLLKYEPNPEMGSMVFRRTLTAHALTCHGGYAEIERDGMGRPAALWPLTPDRVRPYRETASDGRPYGPLKYRVDEKTTLLGDDVIHIHGLGYDGYTGYSVINQARQAIGLALAAEKFGAEFFSTGASIGGILTSDQNYPDDEQEKAIRESMGTYQSKAGRMRQFLLLFGGEWKFEKTGITPNESQMNELRSKQVEEVARFFNMPVHKLKDLERATNNNIEQQDLEYYKGCLLTWITLWEEELNRKLISPLERTQQYVKHNANAFLRGDIQSRYTALGIARDKGIINADEWRELEDMNPQVGGQGKLYLVQTAQVPLDKIGELTQSQIDKNNQPPPPSPPPTVGNDSGGTEAVKAANARADAADALAREAREKLAAAETTLAEYVASGTAKDADISLLRDQVQQQALAVGQFEILASELRATAQATQTELAEKLTESERQNAEAVQRAVRADERATVAEAEALLAKHDAADADARAKLAADLAAEAQRAAESALEVAGLTAQQKAEAQQAALEARSLAELAATEAAAAKAIAESAAEAERLARASADAEAARVADLQATLEAQAARLAEAEAHAAEESAARTLAEQREREATTRSEQLAVMAAEEAEKRAAAIAALEARMASETEQRGRAIAARRDLVLDTMRRMIDREVERASRAQLSAEKLQKWMEPFYEGHEDLVAEALRRPVAVHLAAIGSGEDAGVVASRLARQHVAESKRQLQAVVDSDTEAEFRAALAGALRRWTSERVSTIADVLFQVEVDHAAVGGLRIKK